MRHAFRSYPMNSICLAVMMTIALPSVLGASESGKDYKEALKRAKEAYEKAEKEAKKRAEKRRKEWEKAQEEMKKVREKVAKERKKRQEKLEKEVAKLRKEAAKAREEGKDEEKYRKKLAESYARAHKERERDDLELSRAVARMRAMEATGYYSDRPSAARSWVRTGNYAVPASRYGSRYGRGGGWTEIGGVSRRIGSRSRSGSAYGYDGGSSGTSIGVRATIIRLGGPDD